MISESWSPIDSETPKNRNCNASHEQVRLERIVDHGHLCEGITPRLVRAAKGRTASCTACRACSEPLSQRRASVPGPWRAAAAVSDAVKVATAAVDHEPELLTAQTSRSPFGCSLSPLERGSARAQHVWSEPVE